MHIRKARANDLKSCLKLDHSITTEHAWRIEEQEHNGALTISFQPIRLPREVHLSYPRGGEELAQGWAGCDLFLVASNGREICGYTAVRVLPGNGLAWVQDIAVAPEWRREGIGSQLLREAAAWAVEQHLPRLVVEVQTRNVPGISFCRALGLSFCGYHDRHWRTRDIALLFGSNLR